MASREVLAELLWAEKYRPRTLDEIVNQEEIVSRLKKFVEEKNMPHLLFAGPPGTGKTTAAHCLAHDLYGEEYHRYMLELNASVSKNTPILVRINGKVYRVRFSDLDKKYFNEYNEVLKFNDGEYVKVDNLEVLTVDKKSGKVKWARASWIIRHKVPYIIRIRVKGGGYLELTGNHSIIVIGEDGSLVEKKASELKVGDFILSFVATLPGKKQVITLKDYILREHTRIKASKRIALDSDVSWLMGLYVAEGAIGFKNIKNLETSGQVIITLAYPKETNIAKNVIEIAHRYNIPVYETLVSSGFNRTRYSAQQIRLLYTALARYIRQEACQGGLKARNKRVPKIVYTLDPTAREYFLRGIAIGDGTGEWGKVVRITSTSKELLIDIVWLARITGIESSLYDREARLIWKNSMKYKKSDLLPAKPYIEFFKRISSAINIDWKYILRHQLYEGKETISKNKLLKILEKIDLSKLSEKERTIYNNLLWLARSDLHVLKVMEIKIVRYDDYVYDIAVPNNNMFFAGEIPVLLHNSDERGIDVIRSKVKEFARTRVPGEIPFKIVLLDEADNMTADAQQALRRLMEMYTANTRFILIANYPSKIIEPIQSRCAVFRFTPLKKEDIVSRLKWIADQENVEYDINALETIYEISEGDMRRAINILQAAAALGKVTVESVYKVVGLAHPREVREMIKLALDGRFEEARAKLRDLMINYGLSGLDIIKQIHREIFSGEIKLPEEYKVMIADYAGEIQFRLVEGADDEIQLNAFLARLAYVGRKFKV